MATIRPELIPSRRKEKYNSSWQNVHASSDMIFPVSNPDSVN